MTLANLRLVLLGTVGMVGCSIMAMAQATNTPTNEVSLAALTVEVRQLRLAVEESMRTQAQAQAIGIYLSAQQTRLAQIASRLDEARKELDEVTLSSKSMSAEIARMNDEFLRETNPERRSGLERDGRTLKTRLAEIGNREQLVRSREAELSQLLQTENRRWTDLISRLEELIRK